MIGLTALNLRGVKESILILTPIFLCFLLSHVVLIGYGIFSHGADFGHLMPDTLQDTHMAVSELGTVGE